MVNVTTMPENTLANPVAASTVIDSNLTDSNLTDSIAQGKSADGKAAKVFVLKNAQGTQASFMDIGATWLSCRVPVEGGLREVMLGVNNMPDHLKQDAYFGATIGRYANRISKGRFQLGERRFRTSVNQGEHTLHGGKEGFDKRRWKVASHTDQKLVFTLESWDGEQGFPGHLLVKAIYELSADNTVSVTYEAATNKPCPVNLTNHAYFNLDGETANQNCLSHELQIAASHYVPCDETGIPLGEFYPVDGTGFDFRQAKKLKADFMQDKQQRAVSGYDHAFILEGCRSLEQPIAIATSSDKRVSLQVCTTKPAIHVYSGNFLAGLPNRLGSQYANQAGFALEAQFVADAPNHPEWTSQNAILEVGKTYHHKTDFKFVVTA